MLDRAVRVILLFALVVTGCDSGPTVDDCLGRRATIETGIAGCVTTYDDVGNDNEVMVLDDFGVAVFTEQPSTNLQDGAVPHALATSQEDGFYEIALKPGHYWICTLFRRCIEHDVSAGTVQQLDYEFSIAPGWSERRKR